MASKGTWLFVLNSIFIACCCSDAFLDIDELKSINYGIDILSEPVVMNTEGTTPANTVYLTSKYGQQYQCSFPNQVEQEKEKEEQEKVAMETGIPDLLKPMESGPCLKKTKDWWSYEFCYGKYIRQYHIGEDGKIQGVIMFLGYYESEFDWDNEVSKDLQKKKRNRLSLYHTQQYVNGSVCELTDKQRRTEVRFVCEEGSGDYIKRLDEPETCVYVMTVHTTKICHHPYLKPPTPQKTVPITCNPLLTVHQYQDYLDELEAAEVMKKLKEERRKKAEEERELREEEKKKYMREANVKTGNVDEDGVAVDGGEEGQQSVGRTEHEGHVSDIMKAVQSIGKETPVEMNMVVKMVESQEDLDEFLKEITEVTKEAEGDSKIGEESSPTGAESIQRTDKNEEEVIVREEEEEKEEEGVMDEYESELKSIKERYKDRRDKLTAMKEKVRGAMEEQFDDILKEAQGELGDDAIVGEGDKKKAFETLSNTLNKLINKLDKTEKEISEVDRELGKFATYENQEDNTQTDTKSIPGTGETIQHEASDLVKGPEKTTGKEDGRVKVRVTRVKSGQRIKDGQEIQSKQTEALEKNVEKELEEAGLGDKGGKIHVKIITAGYLDDNDESVHILSDEDSETFRSMIVSIIGGTTEASREEDRHSRMEENYSYVWNKPRRIQTAAEDKPEPSQPDDET